MFDSSEVTSFFNEKTRISILIPKGWTSTTIDTSKFRILGWSEAGFEDYFDEYRPTISYELSSATTSDSEWLRKLVNDNNEEMALTYNQYEIINEEYCEIANAKAYVKHYSWKEESTGLTLFQMQSLIASSPFSLYIVNAAVLKTLEDKYMPIFNFILNSTRIIPRK